MQLSKQVFEQITKQATTLLSLPEKVLQFGTGVLLRALPDYYIDKANKQKVFNGRIVMVKSTEGNADVFEQQDCLYTHQIRGIENGKTVDENIINASVSRVLSANKNWNEVLQSASNKDLQTIISNTTEVGIQLTQDNIQAAPPISFPGKLLAFLYQRYIFFNGDANKGLVIIPTELIVDNGNKLKEILLELARQNNLPATFITWLQEANEFCNSLVDRIVPGKLNAADQSKAEIALGYIDELLITSEPYNLWAIETANEKAKSILSFSKANEGIIIADDITVYRELKLRLLNGTHTFSCGLAHLAGFVTVKDAMNNAAFKNYLTGLMYNEIAPAIAGKAIALEEARSYAETVIERFSNPFIEHKWLSITLQYSAKMAMRNVPVIIKYVEEFKKPPMYMALGFAAYLLFTKPVEIDDGRLYGCVHNNKYLINDDSAFYYAQLWNHDIHELVAAALSNKELWNYDLTAVNGFAKAVENYLNMLMHSGAMQTIQNVNSL